MAQLISRDHDLSQLKNMNDSIEFSMSKVRSKTIEKKRALPSKKQEIKPPEFKSIKPSLKAMSNVDLDIPNLLGDLGMEEGISASDVTPIVRISPQYPPSAAMKKIEGWVVLQFDITSQGTISNVKIIRSNPPRIFDKSAVAAVSKWKYRPKIENGKPVVQSGVRVQIDFNLSD